MATEVRGRRLADEKGQDLAEFALVLPIFALVLFGILEFGIIVFSYNTVANAAREGARYAIVRRDATDAEIATAAEVLTTGLPGDITVTVTRPDDAIQVQVEYTHQTIVSYVIPSATIDMRAVATMQKEY
ncbi:MAG: TadE/TadG family type IV pilus assembly protein [Anaerolineae bacterium]